MSYQIVKAQISSLSRKEKQELFDDLYSELYGEDLSAEQRADLESRIDEFEAGKADMVDGEEALRLIREGR